jgi:hypothetical protein
MKAAWCALALTAALGGARADFRPAIARVDLDRLQAAPGGTIRATYVFLANEPADRQLTVFVHLIPLGEGFQFGGDFLPSLPTSSWPAGAFVCEQHPIPIPPTAEPGRYRVALGLYDRYNGPRIALANDDRDLGDQRYAVGEVEVVPAGAEPPPKPTRFEVLPVDESRLCDRARMRRKEPTDPIVLRSKELTVLLDRRDAVPFAYELPDGARLLGEPSGLRPTVVLSRSTPRATVARETCAASVKASQTEARFLFATEHEGAPAAQFTLCYLLSANVLTVTLEDIAQPAGHHLIEVRLPALASVRAADGAAWLAYSGRGGQLVDIAPARSGELRWTTNWDYPAPIALLGSGKALAVLDVPSYLDTTEVSVFGDDPSLRVATLGTTKVVNVPGGPTTPDLPANQQSICHLTILGGGDWLAGVNAVRRNLPRQRLGYYDERFVYKIFCDMPGAQGFTTFEEAGKLTRDFAALTGNWPQVAYLVGWQYEGHDTGYPAIDVVNARLGGRDGLMKLMQEARAWNCTISMHDNYDDAYPESPAWDENVIARGIDGELMKGGVWAGGQSYIIGMAAYAAGPGLERVRTTCERYRLRDTYHIDVLSAAPLRDDWNPAHPAGAVANLRGKWAIVDEFARHGVDVTSEGMSWPFIGKLSYFWNSPRGRADTFGCEQTIPLIAALYREAASWGGLNADGAGVQESLFYNCGFSCDLNKDTDRTWLADSFYLLQVPWFRLHKKPLQSFHREEDKTVLGFGEGMSAEIDWQTGSYRVTENGAEIARDGATFCRLGESRLAFYSRTAQELTAPLPAGWKVDRVVAQALSVGRPPEPVVASVDEGQVHVQVEARKPVLVYRDAEVIP